MNLDPFQKILAGETRARSNPLERVPQLSVDDGNGSGPGADAESIARVAESVVEHESAFHAVAAAARDAIVMARAEGVIAYWNEAAEVMFGYTAEQAVGNDLHELIAAPQHRKSAQQGFMHFLRNDTGPALGKTLEVSALRADGAEFPVEITVSACMFEGQRHAVSVIRDVSARQETKQLLEHTRQRFEDLVNTVDGIVWEANAQDFNLTFVSDQAEHLLGYPVDAWLKPGFWKDHIHPDDRDGAVSLCMTYTAALKPHQFEYRFMAKDGRVVWLRDLVTVIHENAEPVMLRGLMVDITERKRAEEELQLSATVFANNAEGVVITDASVHILKVNKAFTEITGYTEQEVVGKNPNLLKSGRQSGEFYSNMWSSVVNTCHWQGEIWNRRKSGEIFPEWLSISAVKNEEGQITNYIGVFSDITQRKRAEDTIQHLAHYDALTKLPNRALMRDRLNQEIAGAPRQGKKVGVLAMDLDHFKNVNDPLGHHVGDMLLEIVAERLLECVRPGDTVSRQGGDEFCIILADLACANDAASLAQKILTTLSKPMEVDGQEFVNTASIGISVFPDDGADGPTLLKNADTAMFHAKGEGRNNYQFYASEMNAHAIERLSLEKNLRRALERDEFLVYYQPQVDLKTGRVIGMEALVRWRHPDMGLVSPAKFIPLAEESGLVVPIGEYVLRTACAQTKTWHEQGYSDLRVAVNLSARQFRQQNLARVVKKTLDETSLAPSRLELELTESMIMQNPTRAVATLQQLKDMGVSLSVDDFGTGYSSLSQLKRFPIDILKIDQSFVRDISTDPSDAAIVQAVIALGHSLQLKVIAEGVETAEQISFLRWHRCECIQGYYFSPPVGAPAFESLLKENRRLNLQEIE